MLSDADLDAAVLRHALLGDVELGHDLETRGDGALHLERRRHHLVEHAVDAVAHAELLLERLDVDIARPLVHRVRDERVDELDDRRVLAHAPRRARIVVHLLDDLEVLLHVLHDFGERVGGFVEAVDGALDRRLGRDDGTHLEPRDELDVVDREDVVGIRHRHGEDAPLALDGHDLELRGDLGRNELDRMLVRSSSSRSTAGTLYVWERNSAKAFSEIAPVLTRL